MTFPGGSAWAMVKDLSEGYLSPTQATFKRLKPPELRQLGFEIDKKLRELRAQQPDLDDTQALQQRNRAILRVNGARTMLQAYLAQRR
jgi:hypothetical protein